MNKLYKFDRAQVDDNDAAGGTATVGRNTSESELKASLVAPISLNSLVGRHYNVCCFLVE